MTDKKKHFDLETVNQEDLEIAQDLQNLDTTMRYRPGYKLYLKSSKHNLDLFLDSLDAERRRFS